MKIPLWLIALLFAGYTLWCANFWHNYCKTRCCGDVPAATETSGAPLFDWNAERAVTDANFGKWKKALIAKGGQGDTLVITGYYRADEPNGEKLALARAEAIKALMMPDVPASRIRLLTQQIPSDGLAGGTPPKESAGFSWSKMVLKADQSAIIESGDAVTLLFPLNSTERDRDPAVEDYLKKMVEKHKTSSNTFTVVGYTDNTGDSAKNQALGLARAKAVASFLNQNGIATNRISAASKGEADPVADNNTEDGRHQNRRVVITVNR